MTAYTEFFSTYETAQWVLLALTALLVGMSKTGIQGVTLLVIPLMALSFGAKPSTGLILPLLCMADIFAVLHYRRVADWTFIVRLLPSAVAGFFVALAVDHFVPASEFKKLMGACLLFVLILMMLTERKGKRNMLIDKWWYGPLFGLLGGFTTMIGNAAGPVMAIYLLSTKMPKLNFVGTNAWFFMVVNLLKVPLQIFAWHNITLQTFAADLCCLPAIFLGGVLGLRLVKWLPEKAFRRFITVVTWISVILMLL